jgi:arsenate reductase
MNRTGGLLAEKIYNALFLGRFRAYSAGSHPKGRVHPLALEILRERGHDSSGLRSKGWEEFAKAGAPRLDEIGGAGSPSTGEA